MARIAPLPREELPQHEAIFKMVEGAMGFVPGSMLTMAKAPGLLEASDRGNDHLAANGWEAGKHAE